MLKNVKKRLISPVGLWTLKLNIKKLNQVLGRAYYNESIDEDSEQNFISSKSITYYRDEAEIFPNNDTLYILHSALTKCIEINIRGSSIMHFRGFILGKEL